MSREDSTYSPIPKTMVAGVGAFLILIISVAAFFLLYPWTDDGKDDVVQLDPPSKKLIDQTPISEERNPKAEVSAEDETKLPDPKSLPSVQFDIEDISVDRGGTGQSIRRELPSQRVNFVLKLPEGSPSGLYLVTILDEFGRTLAPELRTSSNGSRVTTQLNLAGLQGPARLCVGAGDEVPDCFSVLIK